MGKVKDFFVNDGPWYAWLLLWAILNAIIFVVTWFHYQEEPWTYLRWTVGNGLPLARGCAAVINFNSALILITVCRNFINFARGCFECRRSLRRLFDKNITFHKYCAYVICAGTVGHVGAHLFNIRKLVDQGTYPEIGQDETGEHVAFTTLVGITGVVITAALILMVTSATEQIRRSYFELFWYTHHLFIAYYVGLILHGTTGFVMRQENFDDVPYFISKKTSYGMCDDRAIPNNGCEEYPTCLTTPDNNLYCCPCVVDPPLIKPDLVNGEPTSYKYVVGPLALYLFERCFRAYRSYFRPLRISKVVKHRDNVLEIQFTKVPTKAGQYVFINCSAVSRFEWHPFTLTSCPELDYCSLHIRIVGDWTSAFAEKCGYYSKEEGAAFRLPEIAIDGPFGTASEDFFLFETAVCVGAGIGVTPFASLLQSVFFRKFEDRVGAFPLRTKKVYFYWICPGFDAWGWFSDLLIDLEHRLAAAGDSDFLTIKVFMTRGWSEDDAANIMLHDSEEGGDTIIRDSQGRAMRHKMNFFRPQWEKEFADMSVVHQGTNVGVFFCGPKVLSRELHENCIKFTDTTINGTKFVYHKENF